jgi:protocatechuate 3,4-dioxygenase beta subunit
MSGRNLITLDRRTLVLGAALGTAGLVWPRSSHAQGLVATPGQSEGPFYPVEFPSDVDSDLVRVTGQAARAVGQVTLISGRVIDTRGQPKRGAVVEIWQCDANGVYHHPRSPGQGRIDQAFQGYGRTQVDHEGGYRFRTIRPVPYPGRTPHIHFAVQAPGRRELITQMYVAGEPGNERDGLYRSIRDARQRAAVTVRLEPANGLEDGALAGSFDLVLA